MEEEISKAKRKLMLLYGMREQRKEFGYSTEQEDKDIALLESQIITSEIIPTLKELVASELQVFKSPLSLLIDYAPGKDLDITVGHPDETTMEQPDSVSDDEPEEYGYDTDSGNRRKSIPYNVVIEGVGKVEGKNGVTTYLKALELMDLDKLATIKIPTLNDYYIVSKKLYKLKDSEKRHTLYKGWWIRTGLGNATKKQILREFATARGLKIQIIDVPNGKPSSDSDDAGIITGLFPRRTQFKLKDSVPMCKNRIVLEIVRRWMTAHPAASYDEILQAFPKELQGNYGVIENEEHLQARRAKGQDIEKRYFLDPDETFVSADGVKFAVSTQWGNNFDTFRRHAKDTLGIEIFEAK